MSGQMTDHLTTNTALGRASYIVERQRPVYDPVCTFDCSGLIVQYPNKKDWPLL